MIPEQTLLEFPLFGDNATRVEPDNNKKSNGWQQGDVVPAEWMNWEWYHASKGVEDLNKGVSSMEKEINAVLASFGITPAEFTNNQLLTAMRLNASVLTATGTTITGPLLVSGGTIRVMFTADIAGTDTTTGLTISYNGQTIPVKVAKDGTLQNFCAQEISTGVYKYLQAYTTLELLYDSVQFIIIGIPIVLSSTDYIIYANGQRELLNYSTEEINTGKTYFGKPVYSKTWYNIPANDPYIRGFNGILSIITNYFGYMQVPNDVLRPFPHADGNGSSGINTYNGNIVALRVNIPNATVTVTLEYTKITD